MTANIDDLSILPACLANISILDTDEHYLIINKPAGLLSVPGRHPHNRDSVIERLRQAFPSAEIVHRLDFDTSGIMVIPLNKFSLSHISKQFQARSVNKYYTAVVNGLVEKNAGTIDLPIAVDVANRPKYKICTREGKKSVTEFTVILRSESEQTSRLLLHPITGRSHQLRLHLQAIGHPILGCHFYGDAQSTHKASRLLLHATELAFDHPRTGKRIEKSCDAEF
jgi:tRNA pseudouridine32 synthase / 23S rRNA pseudouridine746 synthase